MVYFGHRYEQQSICYSLCYGMEEISENVERNDVIVEGMDEYFDLMPFNFGIFIWYSYFQALCLL